MEVNRYTLEHYINYLKKQMEQHPESVNFPVNSLHYHGFWSVQLESELSRSNKVISSGCFRIDNRVDNIRWLLKKTEKSNFSDWAATLTLVEKGIDQVQDHLQEIRESQRILEELLDHAPPKLSIMRRGDEDTGKRTLKSSIQNAVKLTICDPYLFHTPKTLTESEYIAQLLSVLPLETLLELTIFYQAPNSRNSYREFKNRLPEHILLRGFINDSIHDRVWIVDDIHAFAVGTSFGGIGKRYSFLLDLPQDDLRDFRAFLDELQS